MKLSKLEIYTEIRSDIMQLRLVPGTAISEIEIANKYDISRTPVREILKKLSEDSLTEIYPQIGSFVSKIDLKMVEDGIFLRKLCEKKIIFDSMKSENKSKLIFELNKNIELQEINYKYDGDAYEFFNLDNEFHSLMFKYNDRLNIWNNITRMTTHYDRLRLIDAVEQVNQAKNIEEHKMIVSLIENNITDKVDEVITNHLEKYKNLLDNFIKKYPYYFK